MMKSYTMEPTTYGLEPIDAAVLMKKYVTLLGMINYGNSEQKKLAKQEIQQLDKFIHMHLNTLAFDAAERKLGFSEGELDALNQAIA